MQNFLDSGKYIAMNKRQLSWFLEGRLKMKKTIPHFSLYIYSIFNHWVLSSISLQIVGYQRLKELYAMRYDVMCYFVMASKSLMFSFSIFSLILIYYLTNSYCNYVVLTLVQFWDGFLCENNINIIE